MKSLWLSWERYTDQRMDPRPMAMLRILIPMVIILDLLRLVQLGLIPHVFMPYNLGGLSAVQDPHWILGDWLGANAGLYALVITLVCMAMTSAGVWMRAAILLGVLAYAQLGHLYPPGDRAIDRILRTGLLILLFSGADRAYSFRKSAESSIPAWPAHMLRYVLVLIYLSAGLSKLIQQPGWLSMTADPPLLRILIDPMAGSLDPMFWPDYVGLFKVGGFFTIAFELASPLLLTRYAHKFALVGVAMHLGIAATMNLGMFSWGMLAFYPLLLAPFFLPVTGERAPLPAPSKRVL